MGVSPGGPFSVDVVAGRIPFFVWGGWPLVVGGVLGWSAPWVVLPSHALVVLVHGGLWAGGVGWWAVVPVVVMVVVVVVGALVAVAPVVVVMVVRVRPEDPLAFRWGLKVGHTLQPLGPYGLVGSGGGFEAGLNGDRGRGVPRLRVGLADGGGGLWGVDDGALGDGVGSCLRHNYTILIEEVSIILIPLVPVNDTGFETSAEGLENKFIF